MKKFRKKFGPSSREIHANGKIYLGRCILDPAQTVRGRRHTEAACGGWGGMPAAAIGVEHIDAHDKGAIFNKKVMAHV